MSPAEHEEFLRELGITHEELELKLLAAINSGPAIPTTEEFWQEMRDLAKYGPVISRAKDKGAPNEPS
jgi:hypothetical protein